MQVENAYYSAKSARLRRRRPPPPAPHLLARAGLLETDDPREALAGFTGVIELEKVPGEW